jgi:hypothetical protein
MQITPALCSKGFLLPAAGSHSAGNGLIQALAQLPWALQQIQQYSTLLQHTPCLTKHSSSHCQQELCSQNACLQNTSSPTISQLEQLGSSPLLQQHPSFLQQRWYSANDDVARQRLIAAHQRRQREQEALQRRKDSITAASSSSSTELQDAAGTAVVPQESPPAATQVGIMLL